MEKTQKIRGTIPEVKRMEKKFPLTLIRTSQGGQRGGDDLTGGQSELSQKLMVSDGLKYLKEQLTNHYLIYNPYF